MRLVLLALLLGLLVAVLGLQRLELRALDLLFGLRHQVTAWRPPLDDRIVLVGVDEPSFQAVGKPFILWQPELALGLKELFRSGALAVGFDFILHPELEGLKPRDPVRASLEAGELELAQVVLSHPVVLVQKVGAPELRSSDVLHFAASSRSNVAAANFYSDPDDRVRRLPIPGAFHSRLAELVGTPPGEGDDLLINFPGPRDTFPRLSFARVLENARAGRKISGLEGKICLLAPTADSFLDVSATPFGLMPGGEIHAAGLNTVLTRRLLRRAPAWVGWLAPLLAAVLGALLSYRLRPRLALPALLLALLLYGVAALLAFSLDGLWLPVVAPGLAAGLGFAGGYLERYLSVERAQKRTRALFGRFVSPQVMKELLSHPELERMGGRRSRITLLFSDLNDFTPTCERLPPEEVIGLLNRYFQEMVPIIFRHGGTLKQFVGDEIMVIFGAPEPQSDHAARAVRAGLEMVERLQEMAGEGGEGFYHVKMGIHTGEAVVGNVGSEQRSEYAAVGDNVNLAARIESRAKELGAALLVSEATRAEAGESLTGIEWIPRGVQKFKGKTEEVTVYEVRRSESPS